MRRIFMLSLLISISGKVAAQTENKTGAIEHRTNTTLLISELQNKVHEIEELKIKLVNNAFSNPKEKEMIMIQLDDAYNDVKAFIHNSLEESCKEEKRLMEISNAIRPIDTKMAIKYAVMSQE